MPIDLSQGLYCSCDGIAIEPVCCRPSILELQRFCTGELEYKQDLKTYNKAPIHLNGSDSVMCQSLIFCLNKELQLKACPFEQSTEIKYQYSMRTLVTAQLQANTLFICCLVTSKFPKQSSYELDSQLHTHKLQNTAAITGLQTMIRLLVAAPGRCLFAGRMIVEMFLTECY